MTAAKLLRLVCGSQAIAGYDGTCESVVGYDKLIGGLRRAVADEDPAFRARLLEAHRLLRKARAPRGRYSLWATRDGWRAYVGGSWLGGNGRHEDPVEAAKLAIADRDKPLPDYDRWQ